ncbi:phospholipase D-like domain-containing protein [Mucilaginibacter sp. BT774]|uniref:phospholipase D-like domain-containing protein n=1 Tax=Mucilaginibacter sp. BT774 TaxID=3062276 RepID=UPI0026754033|nr:phospholipase D-like domain-containing protein [Mucilaginibacter sp. BT774]MDO3626279.1 phospholipase D-like domain-containing protein [Mucilaginibacter sp. BT774]
MSTKISLEHIDDLIRRNLSSFNKKGVLTVRPGFEISNAWPTGRQAIVATVDKKSKSVPDSERLPDSIGNIPVDVREATGLQRLKVKSPAKFDLAKFHMRSEIREPDWPFERALPGGNVLPVNSHTSKPLGLQTKAKKTQIDYKAPAGTTLSEFDGKTTIIACASPDAGHDVLVDFLKQTASDLTIGMYDFTSADLLTNVIAASKGKTLKMVLDHPPRNKTADQTDEQTRDDILAANTKAAINWALTRNDPVVNEWIYPSAYHIKVVVRDSSIFWLSSGNFNNSNEPNHHSTKPIKNIDRDWHVIVMNDKLAKLYKAFIDNDFAVAQGGQGQGDEVQHHLINNALDDLKAESAQSASTRTPRLAATPSSAFAAQTFTDVPVKIQPLLTPDKGTNTTMYIDHVLDLINSATSKLYIQTQYIHPSEKEEDKDFMKLLTALQTAKSKGIDVRVILSQFENTGQWIEKMQQLDLVSGILRLQENVHNKGIVVDSKVVMVSSENWSADGTLRNRDAGLIISNADIAQYFEKIFLFDWDNKANVKIEAES